MHIDITELLCHPVENRPVFTSRQGDILLPAFQRDVQSCAAAFKALSASQIILFLPDTPYWFYTCLMGALHAGKDIILPAVWGAHLEEIHRPLGTPVITTRTDLSLKTLSPTELLTTSPEAPLPPIGNRFISFFTSGSTGTPKEIRKSFQSLTTEVSRLISLQESVLSQNPVMLASVLPHHIYGMLWRFLLPLTCGLVQDLDTPFTPEEIQEKQTRYPRIAFVTTPSFMDQITSYAEQYHFPDNCLALYSSGSLLRKETSLTMKSLFGTAPVEIFGSSETGGVAWRRQDDTDTWHLFPDVTISTDSESRLIVHSACCLTSPYTMQDAVTLNQDGTFFLRGRLDRLIKIAEERVSLPEVEERLSRWPYIDQSYVLPLIRSNRTVLGAALVLSSTGQNFLKRHGKKAFLSALRDYLGKEMAPATLPRYLRFLPTLPRNAQGKLIRHNIESLFHHQIPEPVIENVVQTAQSLTADFLFLPDDICFRGHFPDYPIVPGVIQLHFVFTLLHLYFRLEFSSYSLHKIKFSNLILPNTPVRFSLTRLAENKFQFSFTGENRIYSSGIVLLGEDHV